MAEEFPKSEQDPRLKSEIGKIGKIVNRLLLRGTISEGVIDASYKFEEGEWEYGALHIHAYFTPPIDLSRFEFTDIELELTTPPFSSPDSSGEVVRVDRFVIKDGEVSQTVILRPVLPTGDVVKKSKPPTPEKFNKLWRGVEAERAAEQAATGPAALDQIIKVREILETLK